MTTRHWQGECILKSIDKIATEIIDKIKAFYEEDDNTTSFYKQSIFGPRFENCLMLSKKSPKKIV